MAETILYFDEARKEYDALYKAHPDASEAILGMQLSHFARMVKPGARFDIKRPGGGYGTRELGSEFAVYNGHIMRFDDFGNYNFGIAARAFGLSLELSIAGAGIAQLLDNGGDITNPRGFFDQRRDTPMIINGYNHAFCKK